MSKKIRFLPALFALALPAPGCAFAETQQFPTPALHGLRLDWCAHFGSDCGKPAADLFCRENGFTEAARFAIDENIGARGIQTLVFGDGRTCSGPSCSGFSIVVCTRPDAAEPQLRAVAPQPAPPSILATPPGIRLLVPPVLAPQPPTQGLAAPPLPPAAAPPLPPSILAAPPGIRLLPPPPQAVPPPPGTSPPPSQALRQKPSGLGGSQAGSQPNMAPINPDTLTQMMCTNNPLVCCPSGQKSSDGCKLVTQAMLDIRVRSYVPPRFTIMGKHYPWGPDFHLTNIVSDITVSGPYPVWPGCSFNVTTANNKIDDSKSILQKAGDLAEAWLGQWSSGVEAAKGFVADGIADKLCGAVDDTQSCKDSVSAVVKTAINVGLSSLGIPPEIPDIQQLRQNGIQYLAAQAASYAIGDLDVLQNLPLDEATREQLYQAAYNKAVDVLSAELDKTLPPANFSSDNPATWGHLQPAYAPHNAHLYVEVRIKPGMYPTYLKFIAAKPDHEWAPLALHDLNGVYASVGLATIPMFIPESGLIMPFELKPHELAYDSSDTAPAQIPGEEISWGWLSKFGISGNDGLVKDQYNFLPYTSTNYLFSDWDLFYKASGTASFRLLSAFGGKPGVLDWVNGLKIGVGTVWDVDTGVGVRTGPNDSKLKNYFGRIDPAPRCDGKPNAISSE